MLDRPLISPLQPTSLISQAVPPLAWSGNLWAWSPQIEVLHHRPLGDGIAAIQFGFIDASPPATATSTGPRQPSPNESSRQPGYEARVSYSFGSEPHPFSFGAGGYYARQKYLYDQHLDTWAGTVDWDLPLSHLVEVSGAFYRGRGLASLGGGAYKDYYVDSDHDIYGLNDEGGWTQLKLKPLRQLEANAAIGLDNAFAGDLDDQAPPVNSDPYTSLARNRTVFANLIFRPRAYLAFSTEYRYIRSWPIIGPANDAQSVGLAAGYIF